MRPLGLGWPNVISIFRILLAPVLVVLVLSESDTAAGAAAAWRLGVLWAAVILTLWSGLDYFWKAATRR
ncbi:MAG: hypothetical protein ACRDIW_07500 [Actinomycetota bacterium]